MKVINIPRRAAVKWEDVSSQFEFTDIAWISISEPKEQNTIVSNPILDSKPNLKLAFWDLNKIVDYKGEILHPPNKYDAKKIVDFILANPNKDIVVNCAAGVSRSGAVAQFCADILGYEWLEFGRKNAAPNSILYRLMVNYYQSQSEFIFS